MSQEEIYVTGLVSAYQGDDVIFENVPNKWVSQGLLSIIAITQMNSAGSSGTGNYGIYLPEYNWNMYIGTNTTTGTAFAHTALQAPIGTTPGTAPNTKSQTIVDGTATGTWSTTLIATWNAGTVTGTVGEMALYMNGCVSYSTANWTYQATSWLSGGAMMFSRLAVADTEFNSFAINTAKPLTINWTVQLSYS